jgi:hypothetical protein
MVATLLFNLLPFRQTAATPSPDKVVAAVLCYRPDVPRHSPLVRLPNMSNPAQEPRARRPHPARGSLHWLEQSGGSDVGAVDG